MQDEILLIGATARLEELNKEREYLVKFIEGKTQQVELKFEDFAKLPKTPNRKADKPRKKKHWTQTPAGRKRMSEIQRKVFKEGRSGLNKAWKTKR